MMNSGKNWAWSDKFYISYNKCSKCQDNYNTLSAPGNASCSHPDVPNILNVPILHLVKIISNKQQIKSYQSTSNYICTIISNCFKSYHCILYGLIPNQIKS